MKNAEGLVFFADRRSNGDGLARRWHLGTQFLAIWGFRIMSTARERSRLLDKGCFGSKRKTIEALQKYKYASGLTALLLRGRDGQCAVLMKRAAYPGDRSVHLSLFFPIRRRPSPNLRRLGSRISLFEACTVFTKTFRPAWTLNCSTQSFNHRSASVHGIAFVTRSGCYQPKTTIVGWDSHPPGKRTFSWHTEIERVYVGHDAPKLRRVFRFGQ